MYLDIFPVFMRKRRIILWMTIVYTILALVTTLVFAFRLCYPVDRFWYVPPIRRWNRFNKHRNLRQANACSGIQGKTIFVVNWSLNFAGDVLGRLELIRSK